jgi:hypothetical protein
MKKLLFALMLIPSLSFAQCVKVEKVSCTMNIRELKSKDILFGVKQITEDVLSEKYSLCDSNAIPVKLEITRVGVPQTTFKIAGVGESTQSTQVIVKLYFGEKIVEGQGSSDTKANFAFMELKDGKIPFEKSTIGMSMKKAIIEAVSKL